MLVLVLAAILELNDGWQYALALPGAPAPAAWSEDLEPRADRDLWYGVTVSESTPADAHIVFRSYVPAFELFLEEQRFVLLGRFAEAAYSSSTVALLPGDRIVMNSERVQLPRDLLMQVWWRA